MSITDFFSSTCQVRTRDGTDDFGEPTGFTLGAAKSCRFSNEKGMISVGGQGKDVLIDGFVYMLPADAPKETDEIVVDGVIFRVIDVNTIRGFRDQHHAKIAVRRD